MARERMNGDVGPTFARKKTHRVDGEVLWTGQRLPTKGAGRGSMK